MAERNHDWPTRRCTDHTADCKWATRLRRPKSPQDGHWDSDQPDLPEGAPCPCGRGVIHLCNDCHRQPGGDDYARR
jgi:hypothetical protein